MIPFIYDGTGLFSDGLAWVEQNSKCGFINTLGEVVIPVIYDDVTHFSEGLAKVKLNGIWSIINTKEEMIVAECDWRTSWARVELNTDFYKPFILPPYLWERL